MAPPQNMHVKMRIKTLPHFGDLQLPRYETSGSVGMDVRACIPKDAPLIILPGKRCLVPTGLAVEVPQGYELQVRPRSGLSLNTTMLMPNSPGTIDQDYRGECGVIIGNVGNEPIVIERGMRIAQWVLCPIVIADLCLVDELSDTSRGKGGFGSTGTV